MTNRQNYNHLTIDQRNLIEHLLNKKKNFVQIGTILKLDRTTISKEVRRNFYLKVSTYSKIVCESQKNCGKSFCNYKKQCYQAKECPNLLKAPYVCNTCDKKAHCRFPKHFYFAAEAQKFYDTRISESKKGYDILEEDINQLEKVIVPLIKDKKQPINHIYEHHKDLLFFSKPTFYRYVNEGVISLANMDLPKKVLYKPRKHKKDTNQKKRRTYLKNRTFDDFLSSIETHPNQSVVEMDTVEGTKGEKCFLTLFLRKTSLLLLFLIDSKSQEEVKKVFEKLQQALGISLYKKVFQILLTDNGSEFLNPIYFERDFNTSKKISRIFYCDPYCSWQKAFIENSHKRIRIVYPKGTSFHSLTEESTNTLRNHIANLYKDKIKTTPYLATEKLFPELLRKLQIPFIEPDDINLSDSFHKKAVK